VVLLVDPDGHLLLQERDEHAPVAPNMWGMVGGGVEEGEDPEAAAYRELDEETGLRLDGLVLWREETWGPSDGSAAKRYHVWIGGTDACDADIVLGEGRQICFVAPSSISALPLGESAAFFVPAFLASPEYQALVSAR
jgi:8-oxo-dGTP pyrophosphatase MutT (NUDIX family)